MRILVSAASKYGSTAEIATALAAALRHHGANVDVRSPDRVDDIDDYDVVVLGSAVYRNRWLRPAREFADRHAQALRGREVYLFSSGPIATGGRPVNTPHDAAAVASRVDAREHRVFNGKLDPTVLGAGERVVVRMVGARPGDFRDWDAIGSWGARIVETTSRRSGSRPSITASGGQPDARR